MKARMPDAYGYNGRQAGAAYTRRCVVIKGNGCDLSYVEEAVLSFGAIMSGGKKDMLANMNRANKGESFVLHFLSMRDGVVLPSELSSALQASTARISALLSALEKKGQIARDIDKNNRRNILVTITQAGRARAEAEMDEMRGCLTKIFTDMGEADTVAFIKLIKQFSDLAQKHMPFGQDGGAENLRADRQ